jgi:sec-independent protein translocase protein TatA
LTPAIPSLEGIKQNIMLQSILLGILGGQEIIIIAILVLLLFGGKKIPELMRGLGKGIKEFKDAKDGTEENKDEPRKNLP